MIELKILNNKSAKILADGPLEQLLNELTVLTASALNSLEKKADSEEITREALLYELIASIIDYWESFEGGFYSKLGEENLVDEILYNLKEKSEKKKNNI